MGIRVDAAAFNNIGDRKNNEDNFYLNGVYMQRDRMDRGGLVARASSKSMQIYAVFDGMGGGSNGEDASVYAATQLAEYQKKCDFPDNSGKLRRFLEKTSEGIVDFTRSGGLRPGACGSTAAMVTIGNNWYRTAHVGDSRVYLLRDGELSRVTKDQSEVQRMVDAGQITLDEAWDHPRKNVITRHLGMALRGGRLDSVISERMPLYPGDLLMICSDGVSDNLRDSEILSALDPSASAEQNALSVVKTSRRRAGERRINSDNITAIVLRIRSVGSDASAGRHLRSMMVGRVAAVAGALLSAVACGAFIMRALGI